MSESEWSKKREQSEWNDAIGYLGRINKLFYIIASCKLERPINTYDWMMTLDALFTELSTFMKEEEVTKFLKDLTEVRDEVNKTINNRNHNQGLIKASTVDKLRDMELRLRKIYKDAGLQGKVQENYEDAWR